MFTIGLKTNLMLSEKNYFLWLTVPKKMKVLLAFSGFSTYSDSVLLPGFPLLYFLCIFAFRERGHPAVLAGNFEVLGN